MVHTGNKWFKYSKNSIEKKVFRDDIVTEEIPEQYKQESEDRRRDLIGMNISYKVRIENLLY